MDMAPINGRLHFFHHTRKPTLITVTTIAGKGSKLLSKIELGEHLITEKQIATFAAFFGVPPEEMERKRISKKYWIEHGYSKGAARAATLIKDAANAIAIRPAKGERRGN